MSEELQGQRPVVGRRVAASEESSIAASSPPYSVPGPPILGIAECFRPGEHERVEASMKALASLKLRHVRLDVAWADWHDVHHREWIEWLIAAWSQQFAVLPALAYVPPCSITAADPFIPPENPKAFADFLDELVDRFTGVFAWIELPSAPAHPRIWDWRLDARGRIFSQVIASAAYRCRQRGVKTVLGGVRASDLGWLSLMCENGVIDFADAIGLHAGPEAPPAERKGYPAAVRQTRRLLTEHCCNAPLWITAAGATADGYDEFAQCEMLMDLLNAEVERIYWSGLHDAEALSHPNGSCGGESWCPGLLRADGTPRLLFRLWDSQGIEGVRRFTTYGASRIFDRHPRRPVLITGGAGFIGSNVAERLLRAGRSVVILDNLSRAGGEHNVRYLCDTYGDLLEVRAGDIRNRDLVEESVARCEWVFHFAAQTAVTTSLADPAGDFASNLQGTLHVLEAVRKQVAPPPLLFTSTGRVYGSLSDIELIPVGKRHVPRDHEIRRCGLNEGRCLDFHSPHGCSKGAADQYVLDYARMYGLPGIVFRMGCIYGPRQLGTEDQGWVAHFILQMLRDTPLTIYGDGRQVRDILYIDDLVDAILLAMENIQTVASKAFNIGGGPGNAVSLLEVIRQLSELSGVKPEMCYGPRRKGDRSYYVSDIRRFANATGWTPQVSATRGISRLYHWILENIEPGVLRQKE